MDWVANTSCLSIRTCKLSLDSARVLSHYHPQYRECFEKASEEISINREIAGLHFHSDTIAGYKLGKYLAKLYLREIRIQRL